MSIEPSAPARLVDLRAAIERELQQRLQAAGSARLQCAECQQINPIDTRFCTQCGAKFHGVVVEAGVPTKGR